jgi:hypothetical protein
VGVFLLVEEVGIMLRIDKKTAPVLAGDRPTRGHENGEGEARQLRNPNWGLFRE